MNHVRNFVGFNAKLCCVRADNAKEFIGGKFSEVISKEQSDTDFAPPCTPELNETAKKFNDTIQNKIKSLLIDSGIPSSMWSLAAEASLHIYNLMPHKANDFISPLNKLVPDDKNKLLKLRKFGCLAYVKIPIPETKFSDRALKTILVGFTKTGYILWHPPSNRFMISRHVQFIEKIVYKDVFKADKEENFEILEENTELSLDENTDSNVENPDDEIIEKVRRGISKTPKNLEESHKIKTAKWKRTNDIIDESECSVRKQPEGRPKLIIR